MDFIRKLIEFFTLRKWLTLVLVLAIFAGIGAATVYRGGISPKQRTDLAVYFKAAEMIQVGRVTDIYGIETRRHWHYVYSPLLAILFAPAARVPFVLSVAVFYFISFVCLAAAVRFSRKFTPKPEGDAWKITLAAVLCFPVLLNTLSRGQMGTIMLFAQAAVLLCYFKGWKFIAGLLLAVAIALKTSPLAALLFFFLFKKEWRVLITCVLSLGFLLIVYPSVVIGFQNNWGLLTTWQGLMSQGSSITAYKGYLWSELTTPFAADNQSLYAVVTRFVWPTQEIFIARATNWVRWGTMACGAASLLLLFLKRQPVRSFPVPAEDRPGILAEYSLYPMLMLIFSPVSQIHHYVSLYFLFFAALLMLDGNAGQRKWLVAGIWICAALSFLGLVIEPVGYWGMPLWGTLFLCGVALAGLKPAPKA